MPDPAVSPDCVLWPRVMAGLPPVSQALTPERLWFSISMFVRAR
jgi:hypothetical protein